MATIFIHPYKTGSESAKVLAGAIGAKRLKLEGSRFKAKAGRVVINWGCSTLPAEVLKCRVINHPNAVAIAANKLKAFAAMDTKARIPHYTADVIVAKEWLAAGFTVVCRTILNGNSGAGIVLAENEEQLVKAPLYVKYVPKKQEYRIHVRDGEVVDVQRKARRKETPDDKVNWKIRNHDNGFIFARNDVACPEDVTEQAVAAVKAVGLDFGAVDVIFNDKEKQAYVLEINTAPGLSGTTLEGYAAAFLKLKED